MRVALLPLLVPGVLAAQQKIDRRWPVDRDASIRIMSPAGQIQVIGWDGDTLAVTGVIPPGGGSFYGGGRGQAAKLGVDARADAPGSTLEVRVPKRARVWLKTISADVQVRGLEGEVDLTAVNGNLTVSGPGRVITAETIDGSIDVEDTDGVLRLRTGGGRITIRAKAGDVTATSVGGNVEATTPGLNRGRLESVTGAVTFTGNLAPGGALELESHSGSVDLHFKGDVNAEFDLTSVTGTVVNQLAGKSAVVKGKPYHFTIGTGGAQVTIRSFKGVVTVGR